jgi:hypothetical protein
VKQANLNCLDVSGNPIQRDGKLALGQVLNGADIERLVVDLGNPSVPTLLDANATKLNFDTSTHCLGPDDTIVLAGWITALRPQKTLTAVDLSGHALVGASGNQQVALSLDETGFLHLCENMRKTQCTEVKLQGCHFTSRAAESLAIMLQSETLTKLDIADNEGIACEINK